MPTTITNVIATLTGSVSPNRTYVVLAHIDYRVTDVLDFTSDSPGADADASGVAVVMELARVMATLQPNATIVFSLVAGEEQGLFGSTFEAEQLAALPWLLTKGKSTASAGLCRMSPLPPRGTQNAADLLIFLRSTSTTHFA